MPWYAAHAILYVRYNEGAQERYPVWENVYLIEAADDAQALHAAEQRAHEATGDSSGSFTYNQRPAAWYFAGIRKLITISHPTMHDQPVHGAEITYTAYEVATEAVLTALVQGNAVTIQLEAE
jgi:Domain of unknown function (DUF4288)